MGSIAGKQSNFKKLSLFKVVVEWTQGNPKTQGLQTPFHHVQGEVSRIFPSVQESKATPLTDRISVAVGLQGYQPRRRVGHAEKRKQAVFPEDAFVVCVTKVISGGMATVLLTCFFY